MKTLTIYIVFFFFNLICYSQEFKLIITSNAIESKKIIDSIQPNHTYKDYKSIEESINKLSKQLDKLGFFEKTIEKTIKLNDSSFSTSINLGNKYEKITVTFNKEYKESILNSLTNKFEIKKNSILLKPEQVPSFLNQVLTIFNNKGYAFASVQLQNFKKIDSREFSAELDIKKNQLRKIDKIIIKGYDKFPKVFLKHLYNIRKGSRLNINNIKSKTNSFRETPFVSEIKAPEILFTKDSTILYLYLKKENANFLDGFLGFSNNATEKKLRLNGYLKLDLLNNLNSGEKLSILYRSTENEQRTFRGRLTIPYLFKSPLGIQTDLEIFKQDSSFVSNNQKINISYQLNKSITLFTGYQYENSNKLKSTDISIEDYSVKSFNLGSLITFKNSFEFRTNELDMNLSYGTRITTSKTQQLKALIGASKSFLLNDRNIIFIKTNNYFLSSESPLTNQLFRLGGIKSIRGFEELSIPATAASILNTEYIFVLGQNFNIHSIIDLGYINNQITKTNNKLISFGFGLDFIRKSNRLSLIFANGKSDESNFNFSNSKVHISLTTRF